MNKSNAISFPLTAFMFTGLLTYSLSAFASGADSLPEIHTSGNHKPAGQLLDGALTIHLEARRGIWYPEEKEGPGLLVQAFAEEGQPPQIPAPLIRVSVGTEIHATIRNGLSDSTLILHGLHPRPGKPNDSLLVPAGAVLEVRFKAGESGTYFYWATTTHAPFDDRAGIDSQLSGALIVDPAGVPPLSDRIFMIGLWFEPADSSGPTIKPERECLVINGRSWPHTERLVYSVGDTIRWRWINASVAPHPMHLHGFYYRVNSRGDFEHDSMYSAEQQRRVVTEILLPGTTMSLSWVPDRPDNWLFHCHILGHISPELRLGPKKPNSGHESHDASNHAFEEMAGLVLGLTVLPASEAKDPSNRSSEPRKLRLIARSQSGRYGVDPGLGFILQEGDVSPMADSISIPGPPIILTRGEPVNISVINKLSEGTSVHWHGIELESYYDGVPGWSGKSGRVAPPIAPGDSFVAKFTPPRAGTFIYHTHMNDIKQLSSGLYGPLIVTEPGKPFDSSTDKIFLISRGGPADDAPFLLAGGCPPKPVDLRVGVTHRFRFINITPGGIMRVSVFADTSLVQWQAIAKDGADLPAAQAILRPARQIISVGETYDFEFYPTSTGNYRLEVFKPKGFTPEVRLNTVLKVR